NSLQAEPGFVLGTLQHETLADGVKLQLVISEETNALSVGWQAAGMSLGRYEIIDRRRVVTFRHRHQSSGNDLAISAAHSAI
ncbi:MAG TPA: hypothetical protein VM939_03000, partial [Gemmatimonadaceae bacterium]|nr:hypothetical protein [Gemmatimonadaceae bacterium]